MTAIQWTSETWNPLRAITGAGKGGWHCERVSPGCQNCYAERQNMSAWAAGGTGLPYNRKSREQVSIFLDAAALAKPLRWKKPRRVFVCSMTDLFGEWVTDEMLNRVFAVMAWTPHITYQVLTKRPERMREYIQTGIGVESRWPLPNVWLGVSAEDQERADERIPVLLETPAAVRFVSAEPLLGEVTLTRDLLWRATPCRDGCGCERPEDADVNDCACGGECCVGEAFIYRPPDLHWVIAGGESGPGARPCNVEWIRDVVAQCREAGVACFVKQLGARPYSSREDEGPNERLTLDNARWQFHLRDRKGGSPEEWPEDLRVREFPAVRS